MGGNSNTIKIQTRLYSILWYWAWHIRAFRQNVCRIQHSYTNTEIKIRINTNRSPLDDDRLESKQHANLCLYIIYILLESSVFVFLLCSVKYQQLTWGWVCSRWLIQDRFFSPNAFAVRMCCISIESVCVFMWILSVFYVIVQYL